MSQLSKIVHTPEVRCEVFCGSAYCNAPVSGPVAVTSDPLPYTVERAETAWGGDRTFTTDVHTKVNDKSLPSQGEPQFTCDLATERFLSKMDAIIAREFRLETLAVADMDNGVQRLPMIHIYVEALNAARQAGMPIATRRQFMAELDTGFGDPWFYGYTGPEFVPAYESDPRDDETVTVIDLADPSDPTFGFQTLSAVEAEVDLHEFSLRDVRDDEAEAHRRSVEGRRATATGYPVGWRGEWLWLQETFQQIRTELRPLLDEIISKKLAQTGERLTVREASQFAYVAPIRRRIESLTARYNVRRYVEALGGDPDGYTRPAFVPDRDGTLVPCTWVRDEAHWEAVVRHLDRRYMRNGVGAEGLMHHSRNIYGAVLAGRSEAEEELLAEILGSEVTD